MKLDESMRARLQRLAAGELTPLDEAARTRVLRHAQAASTSRPSFRLGAAAAVAAIAALTLFAWLAPRTPREVPRSARPAPTAVAPALLARAPSNPSAPCGETIAAMWTRSDSGSLALDLGKRALFVAEANTEVQTLALESCRTRVRLQRGALFVHARELEHGSLLVETPLGSVEVKGTIFGVRVAARELRVTVDEGKVWVTPTTGKTVILHAGQALTFRRGKPAHLTKLSEPIRAAVIPAEVDLELEKVWHEGSLQPPVAPFDPGTSITDEGRPMRKPRVVEGGVTP